MTTDDLPPLDDLRRLDDPAGFAPDEQFRAAARAKGRARTRRRRAVLGAAGVATVLLVTVVGYGGYQKWRASKVVRLDLAATLDPPESESPPDPGVDPPPAPSQAQNILVVGSDQAMPGEGRELVTGVNTDTMMIVRADPGAGTIGVLSLPRDLWVDIPGHGEERINRAWEIGGPELLIQTIQTNFAIPVNHFLQVDGGGFERLVDQAGGSDIWVAGELADRNTGFAAAGPGCVHLDGAQALALVRSRHLELNDPARGWIEDPASDLGRIQRQQLMGRVLASSLLDQDLGVGAADQLLDTLIDNAAIDNTWAIRDMAGLLFWAQGLDLSTSLTTATPPVRGGTAGQGASVLFLDEANAEPVLSLFRPAAPADPAAGGPTAGGTAGDPGAGTAPAPTTTVVTAPTGIAAEWIQPGPPEGGRC